MKRKAGKERVASINNLEWREIVIAFSKGGPFTNCQVEQNQEYYKAHSWEGAALR